MASGRGWVELQCSSKEGALYGSAERNCTTGLAGNKWHGTKAKQFSSEQSVALTAASPPI